MKKLCVVVILAFLACGCATTCPTLRTETLQSVKSVAVVVEPIKSDPVVYNHSSKGGNAYGTGQGGAIGGALEGLIGGIISSVEVNNAMKRSLGRSASEAESSLKGITIQDDLQNQIERKLASGFTVVDHAQMDKALSEDGKRFSEDDYIEAAGKAGADALVYLKYAYGIAIYDDDLPGAFVMGDLLVYDTATGKRLLKKEVSSEDIYRKGYAGEQFFSNNAALFRQEIEEAAENLAALIAAEWDISKDAVEAARVKAGDPLARHGIASDYMSVFKVDCNNPVEITQDCSNVWGAKKKIEIDSRKVAIGGSEDGKNVLVMGANSMYVLGKVKEIINARGLTIERATRFGNSEALLAGYILYTNGDAYSILCEYGKE